MPPRRLPDAESGGDLASYSKFRDRLLLALAALAIGLMGYFVREAQTQAAEAKHDAQVQVEGLRTEIRELRDRLNGELNSTSAFRAEQVTAGAEIVRRLNVLDGKMDGLGAAVAKQGLR